MGKFWLFSAAIESGYIWLAVIGVLNSAISLYYYVRVVVFMWMREEVLGSPITASPAMVVALTVALAGAVIFGVYPRPLFELAELSVQSFGGVVAAAEAISYR
jgi:NADH-quinone oxidoreductase subunit N